MAVPGQWTQEWAGRWVGGWAGGLHISLGGRTGAEDLWLPRECDPVLCLAFRRNGDLMGFINDKVGC